jgi:hypothetical protein
MMKYIHTRNPVSARFLGKSVRTNHNFFKQVYLPKLSNKTGKDSGKNGCCLKKIVKIIFFHFDLHFLPKKHFELPSFQG